RRRHTRFSRDWSSDVCSSDLHTEEVDTPDNAMQLRLDLRLRNDAERLKLVEEFCACPAVPRTQPFHDVHLAEVDLRVHFSMMHEIGRASCRETAAVAGVAD